MNIPIQEELIAKSMATKIEDVSTILAMYGKWSNLLKGKKPVVTLKNGLFYLHPFLLQVYKDKLISFKAESNEDKLETIPSIYEIFQKEEYKWMRVEGMDVIDIGANIGDTPIYFAVNGAKHVYAFEPFPYAYKKAKINIKANHLENKITLLNQAVGKKQGTITLSLEKSWGGSALINSKKGRNVTITTLHDIIKKYKIKDACLKLDCEGSEYGIINNSTKRDLRQFRLIMMEYHYGYLDIASKLKNCGFKVIHTLPRTVSWDKNVRMGLLMATRL